MDIQCSHCSVTWHEEEFLEAKLLLGRLIGVNIQYMYGYGGNMKWSNIKDEPIVKLLERTQSQEEFNPNDSAEISMRLDFLAQGIQVHDYSVRLHNMALGMRQAALNNEPFFYYQVH